MEPELEDPEFKREYRRQPDKNKSKLLSLASRQRSLLNKNYRNKQLNEAKMNELKRRQKKLEDLNKKAYENTRIDQMEKNNVDPKMIEAARIRLEESLSESSASDSELVDKRRAKERAVKRKLNISDKFFHGRPIITKPPIHPFSFNIYSFDYHTQDNSQLKKPKKKKKRKNEEKRLPPKPAPIPPKPNNQLTKTFMMRRLPQIMDGQIAQKSNETNKQIEDLKNAMSSQTDILNQMLLEFNSYDRRKRLEGALKEEDKYKMELKFDQYDRHHKAVRGIEDLQNKLKSASTGAGLARLRAGFAQDRLMDEFKKELERGRGRRKGGLSDAGRRSLQNFKPNQGPIVIEEGGGDTQSEYYRERKERRRKRKEERRRRKEKRREGRRAARRCPDPEEIKKLTENLVQKKLEEALSRPGDDPRKGIPAPYEPNLVQEVNGVTLVNDPRDPNSAPLVVMPDDSSRQSSERKRPKRTKRSARKRRKDPVENLMDKMMLLNMMKNMKNQPDSESSEDSGGDSELPMLIPVFDSPYQQFGGDPAFRPPDQRRGPSERAETEKEELEAGEELPLMFADTNNPARKPPLEEADEEVKVSALGPLDLEEVPEIDNPILEIGTKLLFWLKICFFSKKIFLNCFDFFARTCRFR